MSFKKGLLIIAILGGIVLAFGWYRRQTSRWTRMIKLDGEFVDVTIVHTYRRGVFKMGHWYVLEPGDDKFTTYLQFRNRQGIHFATEKEPRAIWSLRGQLYVACCSGDWFVAGIDETGTLIPIEPHELPAGSRYWNLEAQVPEIQKEWDENFAWWLRLTDENAGAPHDRRF